MLDGRVEAVRSVMTLYLSDLEDGNIAFETVSYGHGARVGLMAKLWKQGRTRSKIATVYPSEIGKLENLALIECVFRQWHAELTDQFVKEVA